MNTIAAPVVALLKKVEAPVLPNKVWLDPPPKAAPMSAPLPVWSSTIMISAMQTSTWIIINKIVIILYEDDLNHPLLPNFGVRKKYHSSKYHLYVCG